MALLFSKAALIEESIIAARVLRCVEAGDRRGLARALEALTVAFIERTQPPDAAEDRKDFVDLHPAADGPLAAFDEVRGRVVSRGVDHWLDPAHAADLVELAAKAAELRAAIEGKPAATIVTGSQAKLLRTLRYKGHYQGKLHALAAKGAIRLEALPLGVWRMEVLDTERAYKSNG